MYGENEEALVKSEKKKNAKGKKNRKNNKKKEEIGGTEEWAVYRIRLILRY